jgi:conjugal transfer ATP-binding protein TraC
LHLSPLIAEWAGTPTPTMLFAGRRGQLMGLDLHDNDLGNSNVAVLGTTGSGKSVLLNELAISYLGTGAKVWMLDLGKSFEKICRKCDGAYVEFTPTSRISLNLFSMVSDEETGEDGTVTGGINEDIAMIKPALAKMCSMSTPLEEVQIKALGAMVLKLYKEYGRSLTITGLRDAFCDGTLRDLGLVNDQRIKDLAVMLAPYSRGGEYERFFEGRANIDFSNDFMVIENEELKRKPDLQAVVNILLMYQITGQMFLTRNRRKVFCIDELKQQLGDSAVNDPVMAAVVAETSRRARKYGGALVMATQNSEDFFESAQMQAALQCSDWLFMLRQKPESIEALVRSGRLNANEVKKALLGSMRKENGVYSDLYITSPVGEGVARLVLDPYSHLLYSNRIEDNAPIDALREQGMSIDEAIEALLQQRAEGGH